MVKECNKKCSNCGHNGHNSRSCNTKKNKEICVKLFGFKIHVSDKQQHNSLSTSSSSSFMRKSKSTPNLNACIKDHHDVDEGYLSDHGPGAKKKDHHEGYISDHGPGARDKKKGVPWTEDEHLSFLSGLEKLGKGDWKGISRNYVHSRTATQVASHAQKYFKRLGLTDKRNRRFSLFDMSLNEPEIKTIPPPEPPDTTTNEEIEKLAHNFPALNVNQNGDTDEQASTFAKADATQTAAPPILPYTPCYGVPDFSQMPFIPMMGMTNNGQFCSGEKSFPAGQSVPMMYIPNPAYFYLPNCPGSQSSSAFFMPPFPHGCSSPMARP